MLRTARNGQQWSQAYVGKRLGVTGPTYARWELSGRIPTIAYMEAVASLLGIPRDSIVAASGMNLNPPAERRLYEPLAEFLAALPLQTQKALLANLRDLALAVTAPK